MGSVALTIDVAIVNFDKASTNSVLTSKQQSESVPV
jgi:hypothetical protein